MDVVLNAEHRRRPLRLVVLALPHRRVAGILARAPIRDADNAHLVLRRMQAERAPSPAPLLPGAPRRDEPPRAPRPSPHAGRACPIPSTSSSGCAAKTRTFIRAGPRPAAARMRPPPPRA